MKIKYLTLFYDNYAQETHGGNKMKAASRLVLMYLLLACCLGLVSLYVGCAHWARKQAAVNVYNPDRVVVSAPPAAAPEKIAARRRAEMDAEAFKLNAPAPAAMSKAKAGGILSSPPVGGIVPASPAFQLPGRYNPNFNTASFDHIDENAFLRVDQNPLSTFSIDVDTASYSIVRKLLNEGRTPPAGAVRIEELVNYFNYDYPAPKGDEPFAVNLEVARCPWKAVHKLVRIGLKGREIENDHRPDGNLVFLLDVSGSMDQENKLPLVKRSMGMLLEKLNERDQVAIVIYAGASGVALPSTRCDAAGKAAIRKTLESLGAGGSTQGSAGIQLAYDLATKNFKNGGTNRVILCTDGDFNVGITNQSELVDLITQKAKSGVFLSVLGFGMDNLKDSTMEKLADKGNGAYGYVDTFNEARRMFAESLSGSLVTIAKDVKIQVEFNPVEVAAYRLIGYENRMLAKEDFNNDKKDAGEIGAGHTVTALYEVIPAGQPVEAAAGVDELKYQKPTNPTREAKKGELLTVKLRYKAPDGETSKLTSVALKDGDKGFDRASEDFRFAAAVAEFGMLLRGSEHKGAASYDEVIKTALAAKGQDASSARAEFVSLTRLAKDLVGNRTAARETPGE